MSLTERLRRALLPAYPADPRRSHELRYLYLEVTRECNLDCRHCGSDCTHEAGGPSLAPFDVLPVLREIRDQYDPRTVTVVLSGGEPLCYPDLFPLGRAITDLDFAWGLVTNGYGWTPTKVLQARAAGMQWVTVSLDGLEAEHDWLRGRAGAFRRAVDAISMLARDATWQAIDVVTCVHRHNLADLDALHGLLRALGIQDWRILPVSPVGRAAHDPNLLLDSSQLRELLVKIDHLRALGGIAVNSSESDCPDPRHVCRTRDVVRFCRAGISIAGITATGDILACPNLDPGLRQGNIASDSFAETWETRYEPFRDRSWLRTGDCESCCDWSDCLGSARQQREPQAGRTRLCHCRAYGPLEAK
jgi:MoaA/NifB/PqqE/SkfB family radical SAM enzyme